MERQILEHLDKKIKGKTKIYCGQAGISEIVSSKDVDVVVMAISGSAALFPLLSAIRKGKRVLLANKEALVMAGRIILTIISVTCGVLVLAIIPAFSLVLLL